jgi:hypothetical protein
MVACTPSALPRGYRLRRHSRTALAAAVPTKPARSDDQGPCWTDLAKYDRLALRGDRTDALLRGWLDELDELRVHVLLRRAQSSHSLGGALRCRIELYLDQGGSAALRHSPASAPPSGLDGPGRRTPGQHTHRVT